MLTHFYGYLYFADLHTHRFYLRFVRDRMHYLDSIFCKASAVVQLIQTDIAHSTRSEMLLRSESVTAGERPGSTVPTLPVVGNGNALVPIPRTYHAYHIRRGDFQHKWTRLSAEDILRQSVHLLDTTVSRLLYISTDEQNRTFFEPFRKLFEVRFLGHYEAAARTNEVNQNHVGMIEQIICANAHTFIGTPLSTFTSFISRMRGYYNISFPGRYTRTYYFMPKFMYQLQKEPRLQLPFWPREFVEAFEGIDD